MADQPVLLVFLVLVAKKIVPQKNLKHQNWTQSFKENFGVNLLYAKILALLLV